MRTYELDWTLKAGIEHDLSQYRKWCGRRDDLEAELADVPQRPGDMLKMGQGTTAPSDPTYRVVQRRLHQSQELAELRRRIGRVEAFLAALPTDEHRAAIGLWYFRGRTADQVAYEMKYSASTIKRLRHEALPVYAQVAGLGYVSMLELASTG